MKKKILKTISVPVMILASLILMNAGNNDYKSPDTGYNNPAVKTIVILPERLLREYDPVTIFYPQSRGPKDGGPEDHPEKYVRSSFDQPGEFRWIDDRTLQFRPAIQWAPLKKITWKVDDVTRDFFTVLNPPVGVYANSDNASNNTVRTNKKAQSETKVRNTGDYDGGTDDAEYNDAESDDTGTPDNDSGDVDESDYDDNRSDADNVQTGFSGTTELFELKQLVIIFQRDIKIEDLESVISVEIRDLPGIDSGKTVWLTKKDMLIKREEQSSLNDSFRYVVLFSKPVGVGKKMILHLKLSLDENLAGSKLTYEFSTKDNFRLVAIGSGNYVYPITANGSAYTQEQAINGAESSQISLAFSDALKEMSYSQVRQLVQFSPSVDKMTFQQSNERLYIGGNFEFDRLYEVTINPVVIYDKNNRLLEMKNKSKFYVYFPQKKSYIGWQKGQGIVELYGPKQFPMQGRSVKKVDLRIYKIDPLSRKLWPFPEYPVVIDESAFRPGPGEEPPEKDRSFELTSEGELKEHLLMMGSPALSRIIDLPISDRNGAFTFGLDLEPYINEKWKDAQAGTYIVGYRNLDGSKDRTYVRLQITDLCLTTVEEGGCIKLYVTSYKTALPVSGCEIDIQGYFTNKDYKEYKWVDLVKGVTDANGMFRIQKSDRNYFAIKRIVLKKDRDILVLNPRSQPVSFNDNYWTDGKSNWFDSITGYPVTDNPSSKGFLFTERPVYKPEEPVHIKGYARKRSGGKLFFIDNRSDLKIRIDGPGGKNWEYPANMTEYGSCYLEFDEKDLPTGYYTASLMNKFNGYQYASVGFSKESYKIPTFEVMIHGNKRVPMDKPFKVSLTADYYAGGKVTGQPVTWTVTEFPYAYAPAGKEGYVFSSDSRFSSKSNKFTSKGLVRIEDVIDQTGACSITVDPTLAMDNMPRRYVFEATVRGADEQTVTATYDVFAIPSFVLGMKADRFIKTGYEIRPSIVAVDVDNNNIPDLAVTVRLKKREWHSHLKESSLSDSTPQYVTEQVDTVIDERRVITENDAEELSFKVQAAGIYLIELEARDGIGRMQTILTDVYVGGDGVFTWKQTEDNTFKTACDKGEYKPGETASILLESPFLNARVLVIVEKPDGDDYSWLDVDNGKAVFSLPVENYYNPRIPVTFVMMSPRIYEEGRMPNNDADDRGKPATLASTQWVYVSPVENTMTVELKHPAQSSPGKIIDMEINLKDDKGNPIPGEVALWLVDQAVLALGEEQPIDPLPNFIDDTTSKILVRDLRGQAIGKLKIKENPGGGGADEEGAKKESMRSDLLDRATVRKNFKTVAFYSPSILIDKSGTKRISVELPDNLTVFRIRAVACSGAQRFGSAKSSIEIRLPLVVQPVLPRFVRFGDELNAGGIGRIVVGEGGNGNVKIEATNAVISGKTMLDVDWKPDTAQKFFFPMKINSAMYSKDGLVANNVLRIKMAVSRLKDEATDAFEVTIPIKEDVTGINSGFMKEMVKNSVFDIPEPEYKPRTGSLKQDILFTSEMPVLKAVYGMEYLLEYPYGCLEQKISKAYSALLLKDIYGKYNITAMAPNVDKIYSETMETMEQCRGNDGLYGYWPGTKGYVYLTAYVLTYLSEAKKAGYNVKTELIDGAVKVLKRALRSDYSGFITGFEYNERIEALFALSDAGYFDSSYGDGLARIAYNYDVESRSRILLALLKNDYYDKTLTGNLKKNLMDNAVFKLFNGKEIFSGMQDVTKTYGGLINSYETKSLAGVISALSYKAPYEGRLKLMLDNLVNMGDRDGWGNTYTNASVLAALKDYLSNQKPSGQKFTLNVKFDGNSSDLEIGGTKTVETYTGYNYGKGSLVLKNAPDSDKKSYVSYNCSYLPDIRGDMIKSQSNGFVVDKQIIRVGTNSGSDTKIWLKQPGETVNLKLGDIVEEHVQVTNPVDRYFVVIECPLAAGLEPMNPNLKTSPPEAKTKGVDTIRASYSQYLDDKVCYYFDHIPKGTFDFYFRTKAMTEGSFVEPAAFGEMMYQESVRGNSFGLRYNIGK
jgi:alpha-2-macroglobulin